MQLLLWYTQPSDEIAALYIKPHSERNVKTNRKSDVGGVGVGGYSGMWGFWLAPYKLSQLKAANVSHCTKPMQGINIHYGKYFSII